MTKVIYQQEKQGKLQKQRQHLILNEENSSVSSEEEISNYDEDGFYLKYNKKRRSRPDIVTTNNPEKHHFENNHKNIENVRNKVNSNTENNKKPFILVVGDSMTKNINSFDLRQKCKGTHFMVRTLSGGKNQKHQELNN